MEEKEIMNFIQKMIDVQRKMDKLTESNENETVQEMMMGLILWDSYKQGKDPKQTAETLKNFESFSHDVTDYLDSLTEEKEVN